MTIEERVVLAQKLHKNGYNCAQAVTCVFADKVDVDITTLFRMTEAFGLGMGDMENTCGAITGANVITGLINSSGDVGIPTKGSSYKLANHMSKAFRAKNGSTLCKELKGVDTGTPLRSCHGCIEDMVRITNDTLCQDK